MPLVPSVLTINAGSSSIKFALFNAAAQPKRQINGMLERLGQADSSLAWREPGASDWQRQPVASATSETAVEALMKWLEAHVGLESIRAVGHRVVHGGPTYAAPVRATSAVLAELKRLSPLDPKHLPAEIDLIEAFTMQLPKVPQIACFDTTFHHDLPRCSRLLPVPRRFEAQGVRRYGFHGLSYSFLMGEVERLAGKDAARGRIILAHLGSGASMAAVHEGRPIDTTMSFTPAAGLVMATRCGDIDPGFLIYLMRTQGAGPDAIDELINSQSGLLGISETSPDMRDLLEKEKDDPRAADAVSIFCYQAKKWIGALAAALGGLDQLVFSGGIGEHAPPVRARICEGLEFLGIRINAARNQQNAAVISLEQAPVVVRVIPTDEELVIARSVLSLLDAKLP
ncbi:MAG TPA: acetate/propionate family kinase [Planctomycetaceae bacterium]|jgi:acetate kinase|nr:acetate/propionate family kinase [Planctomycetaceae bacterium]